MLRISKIINTSPCSFHSYGKIFDSTSKQLVSEPAVIIDSNINYRSMSIEVQMENGTLGDRVDFSNFGCNKLDMSDRISHVASEINETFDKADFAKKREEELDKAIKAAFSN